MRFSAAKKRAVTGRNSNAQLCHFDRSRWSVWSLIIYARRGDADPARRRRGIRYCVGGPGLRPPAVGADPGAIVGARRIAGRCRAVDIDMAMDVVRDRGVGLGGLGVIAATRPIMARCRGADTNKNSLMPGRRRSELYLRRRSREFVGAPAANLRGLASGAIIVRVVSYVLEREWRNIAHRFIDEQGPQSGRSSALGTGGPLAEAAVDAYRHRVQSLHFQPAWRRRAGARI